ncbi:MAG: tetratricopeptide repeat protein, partial [Spirochaetota bacterium]
MKRAIETVPVRKYSLLLVLVLIWGGPLAAQEADPESLNRRGVEAGSEQNYDEARQNFTDAAREYDQLSSRVLHNRGRVYEEQGNIPAAVESYAEAVRRNPDQYQSLERLGYWKYKHGDYAEAVDLGERALSLDPDNPNVKGWIEDAYRKKIEDIEKTAARKQKDDRERYYTTDGDHFPPRYDPLDRHRTELHVTFDFMLRFSHDLEEETLGYEWTPGQIMNFPYTLSAVYRPYREWAFYGELSHQYTGAALPDVSGQSERFEVWYYWKKFIFGGGIFMHHYNGGFFNSEELSMMDLKAGGSLHYESRETVVDAVLYPRLIVPDGQWSS